MAVVIINPNSTETMTEAMGNAARAAAEGLQFEAWTSQNGPRAIQGAADGAAAVPPLLGLVEKAAEHGAEGIVIGCFDDTGLEEAARRVDCPVIGIGQAAYMQAALRNWRFSVVTTLPVSVPVLSGNIERLGLSGYLGRVRAAGVPVLALDDDPDAAIAPVLAEARSALVEDGAETIILGCAGMVNVVRALRAALHVPVIDPVEAAAGAMAWLLSQRARG